MAPTPYAVNCFNCGKTYLEYEEYLKQLHRPNSRWHCPQCGEEASWDDDNYEEHLEELQSIKNEN